MANEATVQAGLQVFKGTDPIQIQYLSRPGSFVADVAGAKGPVPGAFTATLAGTDVDFSELTQPGLALFKNLDATNFVTWGIWDPEISKFYPIGEILPGEFYPIRLSRLLTGELGTGAGTTGPNTNTLRFKADTAPLDVSVEAFEV